MSRLESLPQALRQKILKLLLNSEHVRLPPDRYFVEHYAFEVNVLRVSRTVNKDATEVLYRGNAFIKVHWFAGDLCFKMMTNHEVPFFKSASGFKHHTLNLTIKPDDLRKSLVGSGRRTFLLLSDDIPKFTRLLRILDLANFMGFHFDFKLYQTSFTASAPAVAGQEELLLPFKQFRGGAIIQKVTITGAVDSALASSVKEAMTQKVAWLRGGAWEIHDLALSIKRVGDRAFRMSNADMAMARYNDSREFDAKAFEQNSMMVGLDMEVHYALARLNAIIETDVAMVALSELAKEEMGDQRFDVIPRRIKHFEELMSITNAAGKKVVSASVIARFYHFLGAAELGLEHPNKAGKAFAIAYKTVTHPHYKQGWELAKAWPGLSEADRELRFDAVLANLPSSPLAAPDMKEYMTPEVDSEHWVMRKLGFQGSIPYADRIKPSMAIVLTHKPHPNVRRPGPRTARIGIIKPEVLKKLVEKYKAQMTGAGQGKLLVLGRADAGPDWGESVMDDPNHARFMETMADRFANMWN